MKRFILNILVCGFSLACMGSVPEGYYDSLEGLTGKTLRKSAAKLASGHKEISYSSGTWDAFRSTDVKIVNGREAWWDMYSANVVYVSEGHPGMNVEHSVANSWWGGSKNAAYKDLFHLNPSNSDANSRKSNYPLGEISQITWNNGVTFIGHPVSGQGGDSNYVYEPADEYKGDFARVFMYMFTTYEDIGWKSNTSWMYEAGSEDMFKPWAVELLLKWHRQDPVSEKEIDRNEAIYHIQGNRNPFIDSPELAEYIWGTKKGERYSFSGKLDPDPVPGPGDDPEPGPGDDPEPGPNPGLTEGWISVTSMKDISSDREYLIAGRSAMVAMSQEVYSSSNASYLKPTVKFDIQEDEEIEFISSIPAQTAILKFIPSGTMYTAQVCTTDGATKGYLASKGAKKLEITESEAGASEFDMSVDSDGVRMNFGAAGTLFYNPSAPRFTTYTSSGQELPVLYMKNDVSTSVVDIALPSAAADRIFNLQGIEMGMDPDGLPSGIYIKVTGKGEVIKFMNR